MGRQYPASFLFILVFSESIKTILQQIKIKGYEGSG